MIIVSNLEKNFSRKKVLRGLNFRAKEGELVALLGPNGAGKSTFLRILTSLCRPSSGNISIQGFNLPEQASFVRARLGVVEHQPLLYNNLTAVENLQFFGRLYGVPKLRERIEYILELIGLTTKANERVGTFSRGTQQRLAIGRAILHDPDILLFDEPHTGLDTRAGGFLDNLLIREITNGHIAIVTSHDLEHIQHLATRFDMLINGSITASSSREELKGLSIHEFYEQEVTQYGYSKKA